jgi:anti-anti-sigma factor
MTALRALAAPTGLRHGDHACWTFSGEAGFCAAVLPFLDEGRRRGEQLLLVGGTGPGLRESLAGLPERDAMLAGGQLDIWATAGVYRAGRDLDPVAQVAAFRREVQAAVGRGRPGLRVAAHVSALAQAGPQFRRELHVFERLADALAGSAPLTGMCLYDAALGEEVLGPVAVLHPIQHRDGREPLVHLRGRGPRLELHGEVDRSVADEVFPALVDLGRAAPGEVVVDLAELGFLDVAGARMLHRACAVLHRDGVRLRLVRPRRPVARCLQLFALPYEEVLPA